MAKISLRTYNKEVEKLLEQGQADEAIAHARHTLKFFPKHIETYQVLGKAYLETQRFGDAADVFQRVLSAIPDDFISHVGMSIIREDEGNMDAAIWHMERAYDVQPSNAAIQDELRRLYGKRDGLEPPKIRLTSGALARMYAHGHLYAQAIAEIRKAQKDDPHRLDLQVLLAEMFQAYGQHNQAVKASSELLTKLPYCLAANRILAEELPKSDREAQGKIHAERLHELDPYLAHISERYPLTTDVPDQMIILDKLQWDESQHGLEAAVTGNWMASLGDDMDSPFSGSEEDSDELPEWLTPDIEEKSYPSPPESEFGLPTDIQQEDSFFDAMDPPGEADFLSELNPPTTEADMSDDNIPDWMKDAGWSPRDPNEPEETPEAMDFSSSVEDEDDGEIVAGDVPDWLQAFAPEETPAQATTPANPDADLPDWLNELNEGEKTEEEEFDSVDMDASEIPEWLSNTLPDMEEESQPGAEEIDDVPDWLKTMDEAEQDNYAVPTVPAASANDTEDDDSDIPDWLKGIEAEEAQEEEEDLSFASTDEVPEWLEGLEAPEPEPELEPIEFDLDSEEIPDWMSNLGDLETESSEPTQQDLDPSDVPDWLQNIGMTPESEAEKSPAAEVPETPDWLEEVEEEIDDDSVPEWLKEGDQFIEATAATDQDDEFEAPEWLDSIVDEDFAKAGGAAAAVTGVTSFLDSLDEEPEDVIAEPEPEEPQKSPIGVTSFLDSLEEEPEDVIVEPEPEEPQKSPTGVTSFLDSLEEEPEDVIAEPEPEEPQKSPTGVTSFLDSLEEEPEDVISAPTGVTSFLDSLEEETDERDDFLAEAEETTPTPTPQTDHVSTGLTGYLENPDLADEEIDAAEPIGGDMPDWLSGMLEDAPDTSPQPVASADSSEETPSWMREFEPEPGKDAQIEEAIPDAPEVAAEVPDWVQTIGDDFEDSAETVETVSEVEVPETEDAMAWLEGLAAKQGANEDELLTAPEDRTETTPDWLAEEQPEEPVQMAAELTTDTDGQPVDLSDTDAAMAWLESLAAKQGANEDELLTAPEDRTDVRPAWLDAEVDEMEKTPEPEPVDESPDWLIVDEEEKDELGDETPDWMQSIDADELEPVETPEISEVVDEIPEPEPAEDETGVDLSDPDAAMAWLEGLAARQGANEDELLTAPEDRTTTKPDWLIVDEVDEDVVEDSQGITPDWLTEVGDPDEVQEPVAEVVDEVEIVESDLDIELTEETEQLEEEPELLDEDETMEWLEGLDEEEGTSEDEQLTTPADSTTKPDWLIVDEVDEDVLEDSQGITPDWLTEVDEDDEVEELVAELAEIAEPEPEQEIDEGAIPIMDENDAIAWLESLDAEEESEPTGELDEALNLIAEDEPAEEPEPIIEPQREEMVEEAVELSLETETPEPMGEPELEIEPQLEESAEEPIETDTPAPVDEPEPEIAPEPETDDILHKARTALRNDQVDEAIEDFTTLIDNGESLPEIIEEIEEALQYHHPVDIMLWQTLGDAFMRNDQLQEALDAYTKAEELLR